MKSLDLFLPYVVPHVPGAPEPDVKRALRSAMIEFCRFSSIVQEIALTSVSLDEGEYDVEVPGQMQVDRVLAVMFNTRELRLVPAGNVRLALALRGAVGTAVPESNEPNYAYFKTPSGSTFSVYPLPGKDATEALTVKACFSPTRTATQVADIMYDDWVEDIADGAMAILHSMPQQPFTSSSDAMARRMAFKSAMVDARIEASKGRITGSTVVRPNPLI